jgi:hypothetical protein
MPFTPTVARKQAIRSQAADSALLVDVGIFNALEEPMLKTTAMTTILVLCITTIRTGAHHGGAAYDLAATTTLDATIVAFKWMNPHALIEFDAVDHTGVVRRWIAETAGLTILLRAGWSATTLQPGMTVRIGGHAARNGTPSMLLERVVLSDRRTLTNFVPR